jgi:hypothetical protein
MMHINNWRPLNPAVLQSFTNCGLAEFPVGEKPMFWDFRDSFLPKQFL